MQDMDREVNRNTISKAQNFGEAGMTRRIGKNIHEVNESAETFDLSGAQVPSDNARSSHACRIGCSTGIVYDNNKGGGNNIHSKNMKCQGNNADKFDGEDKFYYFKAESGEGIEGKRRYTVTLSDLNADLDLFVYTLDSKGYVRECKGVSITIGDTEAEHIELTGLNEGYYLVVVDAWMTGVNSSYALEMTCDIVSDVVAVTPCWDLNGNGERDVEEDVNIDHVVNEDDCLARLLKEVEFVNDGQLPGEHSGSLKQVGTSRNWILTDYFKSSGQTYTTDFVEIGRNQYLAYFYDGTRDVMLEVDVLNNQIIESLNGNPIGSSRVTKESFKPGGVEINGTNLNRADFRVDPNTLELGSLEYVEEIDLWREYDSRGTIVAEYREISRDEWSVYLQEEGTDLQLHLSTFYNMIYELGISWEPKSEITATFGKN